jgi:hypothetical protein
MDKFLKILGIVWGVVTFVAAASFLLGSEYKAWEVVKERVHEVESWPPSLVSEGLNEAGERRGAEKTSQVSLTVPKGAALILIARASAARDGDNHIRSYLDVDIFDVDAELATARSWTSGGWLNPDLRTTTSTILGEGSYLISAKAGGGDVRDVRVALSWALIR